jgi:hypothetical protein
MRISFYATFSPQITWKSFSKNDFIVAVNWDEAPVAASNCKHYFKLERKFL